LQHYQVTVREPNSPPEITSASPPSAVQGLPFEFRVHAQDTADEALTFRLDAGPPGMTLDPATGVLRWPNPSPVGTHPVTLTVLDDRNGATTQSFTVEVLAAAANEPVQVASTPRTTIDLGSRYVYQVQASDANPDPLTFLLTGPAGMTIDGTG